MKELIYALAIFSVAWSLANEEGPAGLFDRMRNWLRPKLGEGVDCPICVGWWVSVMLFPVYLFWPLWLTPFAGHAFVIILVLYFARRG